MSLLWMLLACQEPFGSDRHVLEDFRIAAVSARSEATTVAPRALLVVDGHLWSDEPVDLVWAWIAPDQDPATWEGFGAASGPLPSLEIPAEPSTLLLVAIAPDGTERRAVLQVGPNRGASVSALQTEILPLNAEDIEPDQLELRSRAKVVGEPGRVVRPGGFVRVYEPLSGDALRWMSLAGTWFELEPAVADWTAADLVVDDDEIESRRPLDPATLPMIGVRPADQDGGGWAIADLHVGEPAETGAWVADRWIPGAIDGWQLARLVADPQATTGLRAEDAAFAPISAVPTWEPTAGCSAPQVFDPSWLVVGACTRADYLGREVYFEGHSDP